jgi:N-acetylglucosamine-6-phosphate deacetylase
VTALLASRLLGPQGLVEGAKLTLEGGRVARIEPAGRPCPDRLVCPGFVELQFNGAEGVEVAGADGSDWEVLERVLVASGVTAWCPTLTSAPLPRLEESLERVAARRRRPAPRAPRLLGAHLEGPFLGGCPGAHDPAYLVGVDLDWLRRVSGWLRVVTLAPEAAGAPGAAAELASRGVLVALGHSTATYEQAEEAVEAGARLVTHLWNAMAPLHHRRPGLVGAALADRRLAVSLIADLHHVHPAVLAITFAAKGPDQVVLVTDAVASASPATGPARLEDGTLAGSALRMDQAVRNVVTCGAAGLEAALRAASANPARLLGLPDQGCLKEGGPADLVALGAGLEVEATWVGGELAWSA